MDFLNDIQNNTLIICDSKTRDEILLKVSTKDKLLNLKIMSKNEFLKHFFFNYNEETLFYIKNKYRVTLELANIYLDNLKYVIDSKENNVKINFLQELYLDLKDKELLKFDIGFKKYLEQTEIVILEDNLDDFTLNIFKNYNYKIIVKDDFKRESNIIYHFKTIEEEVEYVFNKISELLKDNVDIKNIKIISLGSEYESLLKRFSGLFHISLNNVERNSIYSCIDTKHFRELINTKSKQEVYDNIKNHLDKEIYVKFLNIINKYYFVDNLSDVLDFIDNDLKNTYLQEYSLNAIDIIDLNSYLINECDYVFVLGFNNENIPKTHKDIDYFNDDLKIKLGLLTSFDMNKYERLKVINNINNIKNITITYKDNTPYNTYYPSILIEELNLIIQEINTKNTTSNLYNKIKLANNLDALLKYNVKNRNLSLLYNTYPDINYLSYSNAFKGLNNFKLNQLTLSYSSMNTYYQCAFRYYIQNILKLNIYEESFKQFIGTTFHEILSHMYNKDFNLDLEWNTCLKDKTFSSKEHFFLKELRTELENIIKVLKYQYSLTGLTDLMFEKKITIDYDETCKFTGIIDKIMFKEKEGNTYISIIDYKTGTPKINLDNLKYGLDMQLPIYVYLILNSNTFNNPQIIGFYLEQILHEKSSFTDNPDKQNIDNLKLRGFSSNDPYLLSMFDDSYENSDMIHGMKVSKNGFYHYSKVLSNDDILKISSVVEDKVKEAFNLILKGDFTINPKVINGEIIGCSFCKYQDLCFMTGKDLVYLKSDD